MLQASGLALMALTAYCLPVASSVASLTSPKPPVPRTSPRLYLQRQQRCGTCSSLRYTASCKVPC